MHVYCNFLLLTSKEKLIRPPHFFWAGDATVWMAFSRLTVIIKTVFMVVHGNFSDYYGRKEGSEPVNNLF